MKPETKLLTKLNTFNNKVQPLAKLAAELLPLLPRREDNLLTLFLKGVTVMGTVQGTLEKNLNQDSELERIVRDIIPGFETHENLLIVNSLVKTPLQRIFKVCRYNTSEKTCSVVHMSHEDIGSICVLDYTGGGHSFYSEVFYTSKEFKFDKLLEQLWLCFNHKINLNIDFNTFTGRLNFKFSDLIFTEDPISKEAQERLEKLVERQRRFKEKNFSRTYLLAGPPGVGKTTFSMRFAKTLGHRILRVNAASLTDVGTTQLGIFLTYLNPEFLLVEDIDRELNTGNVSIILETLTDFKEKYPQVTVVLTANNLSSFDTAVTRPGRIDSVLIFETPNLEERKAILQSYFKEYGLDQEIPSVFLAKSEGLTAAYLKDIAIQVYCGEEEEEVLNSLKVMRGLVTFEPTTKLFIDKD